MTNPRGQEQDLDGQTIGWGHDFLTPPGASADAYEGLVRSRFGMNAGQELRLEQIERGLDRFYADHPFLKAERIATQVGVERHYNSIIENSGQVGPRLNKPGFRTEQLAAYFAASSILGQTIRPIIGSANMVDVNAGQVRRFLLDNCGLLTKYDGVRGRPESELCVRRYNNLTHDELNICGLGSPGLARIPAVLAVLAADVVMNSRHTVIPMYKVDERLVDRGRLLAAELKALQRLDSTSLGSARAKARRGNMTNSDKRALAEYEGLPVALKANEERQQVLDGVSAAAQELLGYSPVDRSQLHIMSELLVAKAHECFTDPDVPGHVTDAIAVRILVAAGVSKVRGEQDLPKGEARSLYRQSMSHYRSRGLRLGVARAYFRL